MNSSVINDLYVTFLSILKHLLFVKPIINLNLKVIENATSIKDYLIFKFQSL